MEVVRRGRGQSVCGRTGREGERVSIPVACVLAQASLGALLASPPLCCACLAFFWPAVCDCACARALPSTRVHLSTLPGGKSKRQAFIEWGLDRLMELLVRLLRD